MVDRQQVLAKADDALAPLGLEAIEVVWEAGSARLVIYIDWSVAGQGVEIEDCVAATQVLRAESLLPEREEGSYQLEVSSPGVERPLRKGKHFAAACGREIRVQTYQPWAGRRRAQGIVETVDSAHETLVLNLGSGKGTWAVPLAQISKAHVVFDWKGAAR